MRYLQRDKNGRVCGHYANPQPYAMEEVPDDHPDLVAWQNERTERIRRASEEEGFVALAKRVAALEATVDSMKRKA